jgi:CubicO group peptidase (beta-lactamase class C family)
MKAAYHFCLAVLLTFCAHGQICPVRPPSAPRDINATIAETEGYLHCLQNKTNTPGLAMAIVYKDQVAVVKGYGLRKLGEQQTVDENTMFEIASLSKPISSTVMASLVSTGDVNWDDRIVDLDPDFRLSDANVGSRVTLRDMFSHRSGLPAHVADGLEDLGYTRPEALHRLRYVPLTGKFRETYAYTNFGLTEAAIAAAKKMNHHWEDIADERLFHRLSMTNSSYRFSDYQNAQNKAALHVFEDGRPVSHYVRDADAEAPAGGVSTSVRDLSQWLRMQIAGGRWNGEQIIDAQALGETHEPIICKGKSTNGECDPGVGFYGLGWDVSLDSAGHKTLSHSGAFLLGSSTTVRFSPQDDVGIIVLSNTQPTGVPESIALTFMDLFQLGKLRVPDWFEQVSPAFKRMIEDVENASPNYSRLPSPGSPSPSEPLGSYAGRYFNRYFGTVEIVKERDFLAMRLPPLGQHYDLQHWDGDTFTYYIAGESSGIGRRGVKFVPGQSLLLQNFVAKDESGAVYEDAVFVKEAE